MCGEEARLPYEMRFFRGICSCTRTTTTIIIIIINVINTTSAHNDYQQQQREGEQVGEGTNVIFCFFCLWVFCFFFFHQEKFKYQKGWGQMIVITKQNKKDKKKN